MIPIKNQYEIQCMREVCSIAATVLERMCSFIEPGINTYELDQFGKKQIEDLGAISPCYNYQTSNAPPFPAYTCISLNEEVVHGIGSTDRIIQYGDIVSVDVAVEFNGFIGDNARTIPVGSVVPEKLNLLKATEDALYAGIKKAKKGSRVGDLSSAIQKHVESFGFSVVRDFVGHGIGKSIHEEPQIPNYGRPKSGPKLKPGMTLAIEPMVNIGLPAIKFEDDGWTATTQDGSMSAHFEHTVLITEGDAEILTIPKN